MLTKDESTFCPGDPADVEAAPPRLLLHGLIDYVIEMEDEDFDGRQGVRLVSFSYHYMKY